MVSYVVHDIATAGACTSIRGAIPRKNAAGPSSFNTCCITCFAPRYDNLTPSIPMPATDVLLRIDPSMSIAAVTDDGDVLLTMFLTLVLLLLLLLLLVVCVTMIGMRGLGHGSRFCVCILVLIKSMGVVIAAAIAPDIDPATIDVYTL